MTSGPTSTLHAQGPRGAGPDARTPAAGILRIGIGATWTRNAESYDANGTVRELGARFSLDPLGTTALPLLAPIETATRSLAALPDFGASLGASVVHARKSMESTPLALEYGITPRIAVGVVIPLVTSISRVDLALSPLGASLGFNPSLTSEAAADANRQLLSQFAGAATFLNGRLATCAASPSATGCAAINTNAEAARALVLQSTSFATTLGTLYGGAAGGAGARFVPLAGSAAQAAIDARIAGFKAQYASLGATQIQSSGPVGAGAPLTASDFQRVLTDSAYGIIANPLGSVVRRGIGDIALSATWQWHDSWTAVPTTGSLRQQVRWRSAVVGTFRHGTGSAADPADLISVPLGDGQNDVEILSITDAGLGSRFSFTTLFRYTVQAPSDATVRFATGGGDPFPNQSNTVVHSRDPGDEFEIAFFPRVAFSEAISLAASYSFRSRTADNEVAPVITPAGPGIGGLSASRDVGGEARAHALGASLAYSTVASHARGGARWPLEISLEHFQTTRGSGGNVPKLAHDAVTVRWYWRPFGRGAVPTPPPAVPARARD